MPNTFYPSVGKASTKAFMVDFIRFLMNDLAGYTGPGWSLIDTYSNGSATMHAVPTDPHDMDTLPADNGWRINDIRVGDYVVLESLGVTGFQVGIEYQATNAIRFILAPTGGFDIGKDAADMTDALNWTNPIRPYVDVSVTDTSSSWSVVANASRFYLIYDLFPTLAFLYCGEVLDPHTGDNMYSVITTTPANVFIRATAASDTLSHQMSRVSKVDGSTVVNLYPADLIARNLSGGINNLYIDSASGEVRVFPVYLLSTTAGNYGCVGKLDGVYISQSSFSGKGTINNKSHGFVSNNSLYAPIFFDWDGVTSL